ncbi:hypothetical protein K2173_015972 [Erythroxylum novogranatense]|uniref:MADS-box domain-containing protein n=1 Tax=Erythroxylum novogranatense TaxID=1862640 RepID=A0AAV8SEW8_9ROSI|nr:hypothetical protein K2173_015972 [Erythroxylum novogranatense]
MGRRKLKVRTLECVKARQAKYSKRKVGILKKAKELATLCDIDLALLMFSPTGKPCLYVAKLEKKMKIFLEKLAAIPVEDREAREELLQMHQSQLKELKNRLKERKRILREWTNPQNVSEPAQLRIMEDHIQTALDRLQTKKVRTKTLNLVFWCNKSTPRKTPNPHTKMV